MNVKEINKQKWNIDPDYITRKINIGSLGSTEQEFLINDCREDDYIMVHCSNQTGITELKHSEYFILTEILISTKIGYEGFILEVVGLLERKGLTIRKKKPVYTEEEKRARSERARINLNKIKD